MNARVALYISFSLCSACTPTRWAAQWAEFSRIRPEVPLFAAEPEAVQAFGMHGFRFAKAGAYLFERLDPITLPWQMSAGDVISVAWAGDREQLSGDVVATSAQHRFFIGVARRLAIRERAQTALLMVAIDHDLPPFHLPIRSDIFDLDLGVHAVVPVGALTFRCVTSQARLLSIDEMKRIRADQRNNRMSEVEAQNVHDRLSPYLAVDPTFCR